MMQRLTCSLALCTSVLRMLHPEHFGVLSFAIPSTYSTNRWMATRDERISTMTLGALGDYELELEKPLGMILEERNEGGVYVKEVLPDGAASQSNQIVPRDILLTINSEDVSNKDFDSVMNLFLREDPTIKLTLGDGLGTMNMPKNVVNQLKSKEDAFFIDAVVREAVREIRKDGRLGDLLDVEVVIGAGVNGARGMVRFFAIFSTDGVSTYSCNVSATGVQGGEVIKIVSLSCAKDEGLGRTFDLITEV